MARFVFKLQPVLDQRERAERDKMLVVAELERERLALESRIRTCQQMMSDERRTLAEALSGGNRVDVRAVKLQAGASLKHNFDAQRAVLELAGVFKKLEIARAELAQASASRKAVEMLRDQQREAFEHEQDMRETRELDEMSVMRHTRDKGFVA
ncbi:MAG: flagellar export protein FliJ [Phycisphaerales bacterium JB052]